MLRRPQGREASKVELAAAEDVWAAANEDGESSVLLDALAACYQSLAGRMRDAADRFYAGGQSRQEIAAALGATIDGVKSLLRRTRATLRECIERRMKASQHKSH
jgi:RNA polymerase sigma-70 factor (ECF subfamily)